MAKGARLILLVLLMKRRYGGSSGVHGERMAFKTQQVHLTALEQARIGRAMRRVAGAATFDFHCLMLEDKGTGFVRVALETDSVLGESSLAPGEPGIHHADCGSRCISLIPR